MSTEGGALYSKKLFLLALKGQISVHFADGHILEGEFITQDEFNVFLMVDDKPTMIPRSQIRYIMGQSDQQIEEDTSQQALLEGPGLQWERGFQSGDPDYEALNLLNLYKNLARRHCGSNRYGCVLKSGLLRW